MAIPPEGETSWNGFDSCVSRGNGFGGYVSRGMVLVIVLAGGLLSASPALALPNPPVNQSPPVLGPNLPVVGATVKVTPGTWTGEDQTSTTSYQWYRYVNQSAEVIPGATGTSHRVRTADEGGLTVLVTVTADSGAVSGSAYSNAIAITIPYPPSNVSPPVISGKAVRGSTLHVSSGRWSQYPSPIAGTLSFAYRWLRCEPNCTIPIAGATGPSYAVRPADWGRGVAVKVTATDKVGSSYVYSNAVAITPPTVVTDDPPFGRWVAGDPLLITDPPGGQCFGAACPEGSVSTLLRHDGYVRNLKLKKSGRLSVQWVTTRAGKSVTIGAERAAFPKPGTYRTSFRLTSRGAALLRSTHGLGFLVVGWFGYPVGQSIGCEYTGKVTRAGKIMVLPTCHAPGGPSPF